ncbi:MAG: class I SAM-dependent rRNA methyltransferase [Fervidicoccaceae archaeon]
MDKVVLKEKAEKFLSRRAYTIYSKWIKEDPAVPQGSFVEFVLRDEIVARGFYERIGPIGGRILAYVSENDSRSLEDIIEWRLEKAYKLRMMGGERPEKGYRLLYADSDGTPGLIADVFGDTAVLQSSSFGWDSSSSVLARKIVELGISQRVYLKNDQRGRKAFGLPVFREFLIGAPPPEVVIEENGYRVIVNYGEGQKTGFYIDQREARRKISEMNLKDFKVLDLFSYTGSFSLAALTAGASSSILVDEDEIALEIARRNMIENGFQERFEIIRGRVEKILENLVAKRRRFDLIIADPPAFIPTLSHKERGMRAYANLFRNSMKIIQPGGLLYASSCSHSLREEELLKLLREAARSNGFTLRVIFHASEYNAIPYVRSEDSGLLYLKGFLMRVE